MLLFLPWCRLNKPYQAGDIEIVPFERHKPIDRLDDATQCRVNTIMATYKTIESRPVDRAALVRCGARPPTDDLSEEEIETTRELVDLVCFSALANRAYFNPLGPYSNSDCFTLYIQKFDRADFIAFRTRRREGQTLSGWPIDNLAITIPVQCHGVQEITLDAKLLNALTTHRSNLNNDEWGKWQNAITCFNRSNTDSESILHQAEWVLLCSGFEHLLEAAPNANDVASGFSKTVIPSDTVLSRNAKRRSDKWTENENQLRYEWMREFYRIRGAFAHGKLQIQQPALWNSLEHLVLATIAFPLTIKCLLQKAGLYDLSDDDRVQIDSFEPFADTKDFLKPPSDQKGSLDNYWQRICNERKSKLLFEKAQKLK
jgi:hypothetical protein